MHLKAEHYSSFILSIFSFFFFKNNGNPIKRTVKSRQEKNKQTKAKTFTLPRVVSRKIELV